VRNVSLSQAPLVFLDVETTGLRPDLGDRVVEIALLRTIGFEEVERFAALVNPQRPLNKDAMRVNHITPSMVAGAPTFAEIVGQIQPLLQDAVIVAHNAPFDMGFLQTEFQISRADLSTGPILDTLMLARRQYDFYSNSLGNIARSLKIAAPDAHRALGDVLTTHAVFQRFAADLQPQGLVSVGDWLRLQGGVVWRAEAAIDKLADDHPLKIALTQSRALKIDYRTGGGRVTTRIIEPKTVSGRFVVAFCRLRQEQRTFRLDRILKAELMPHD